MFTEATWPVGSEEARLCAGLRPPPKLHVRILRVQLSRRLSDARMQEKVLSRATGQARTRRTTWSRATVSSLHCANVGTDATRFAAGSNRRDVGRVFGLGHVCNTRPYPARADSTPQSVPWSAEVTPAWFRCRTWSMKRRIDFSLGYAYSASCRA